MLIDQSTLGLVLKAGEASKGKNIDAMVKTRPF